MQLVMHPQVQTCREFFFFLIAHASKRCLPTVHSLKLSGPSFIFVTGKNSSVKLRFVNHICGWLTQFKVSS